ncbi:SDR family NAD(P)-dependent oxidoreductase [bacterium]
MTQNKTESRHGDIAIIGLSGRFPGANSTEEFWNNLVQGKETISILSNKELHEAGIQPSEYKNPRYVKAKGIVENIDQFDAEFFGYPPKEAEKMDPQIRLLHECCWEALEKAGVVPDSCLDKIGLYVGANENSEWLRRIVAHSNNVSEYYDAFLLNQRDYIATRISYKLDLKGPSFTLLSACSTSLVAVHLACQGIRSGNCSMALAGGVSLSYPQKSGYLYQDGFMVSSDGHCRTFDAKADGTVFGDGAGIVLLKPLTKALEDRDTIYAVIKGSAINNDGNNKAGFTAPSMEGQLRVIQAAHEDANIKPESIGYVEVHGTATLLGDPIEFQALQEAFHAVKKNSCFMGAVKTNIGHVNIAAGISSFIKTALCLYHKTIPPTLHFSQPNPHIDLENSPFQINTDPEAWPANGHLRRAGVSAFGFGGTNAHMVLEEAPKAQSIQKYRSPFLLNLSAHTPDSLEIYSERLATHLKEDDSINLADAAYTLAVGRKHFPFRRAIVCGSREEAIAALEKDHIPKKASQHSKLIFMFPGQGSQTMNMGRTLYETEPEFREQVDNCALILKSHLDLDVREILYPTVEKAEEAANLIKQTRFAQPMIFIVSYALAKLWSSWGVHPDIVIGHSIGECAAGCVAGVLSLEDSLEFLSKRGDLMQNLPPGGMLAVSLSEKESATLLEEDLSIAAVNSPRLTIISGPLDSLEKMKKQLRKQGIASQYLATSHAFHSSMLEPVIDSFFSICDAFSINEPRIPMMSTVTGDWIQKGEITKPDYWIKNIRQPVLFSQAVLKLLNEPDCIFLEVGPDKTLSNLVRMHSQQARGKTVLASMSNSGKKTNRDSLTQTLGQLWEAGINPDWHAYYADETHRRVPLPTTAFDRRIFWLKSGAPMELSTHPYVLLDKKIPDITDWFSVPSWKRSVLPFASHHRKSSQSCCLVFMDTCGLGDCLIPQLESDGWYVIRLYHGKKYEAIADNAFVINPAKPSDYRAFSKELEKMGKIPGKLVHLWNVNNQSETQSKSVFARADYFQKLGFFSLLYMAQSIGKVNIPGEIHLYVVSNHVQDVDGTENIMAEKAPLLGPVKVIPQEYSVVKCCNIDIQMNEPISEDLNRITGQVIAEINSDIPEVIVAYRGSQRWIQTYEKVPLTKPLRKQFSIRKGGTYLITGGLGGIALVMANYFCKSESVNLILTTRKSFPEKSAWNTWLQNHRARDPIARIIKKLQKLEEQGACVHIISADVTNYKKMKVELENAEQKMGSVNGVIHAAGLPGEGILQLKKQSAAKEILAPKIQGTLVLNELLNGHQLDFFVLCSSIASVLGGIGLGDYCAANAFQDAFALQHQNNGNHVISINWDMWGQVGMGFKTRMPHELKEWFERELRNGITSSEGIEAFRRIVGWSGHPNMIVSTRDLNARIDLWLKRGLIKQKEKALKEGNETKYSRPDLATEYLKPETEVEKQIARIWGCLFGIDKVGRHDNFYELGGHSLLATTLLGELRQIFGTTISIRDVMDNPTVSELSLLIEHSQKSKQRGAHAGS